LQNSSDKNSLEKLDICNELPPKTNLTEFDSPKNDKNNDNTENELTNLTKIFSEIDKIKKVNIHTLKDKAVFKRNYKSPIRYSIEMRHTRNSTNTDYDNNNILTIISKESENTTSSKGNKNKTDKSELSNITNQVGFNLLTNSFAKIANSSNKKGSIANNNNNNTDNFTITNFEDEINVRKNINTLGKGVCIKTNSMLRKHILMLSAQHEEDDSN